MAVDVARALTVAEYERAVKAGVYQGTGRVRVQSSLVVGMTSLPEPDPIVFRAGRYRKRLPRADECLLIVEVTPDHPSAGSCQGPAKK